MKKSLILVLLPFLSVEAGEHPAYEMPNTQVIPIKETETGRQYELYIKLPESYSENNDTE